MQPGANRRLIHVGAVVLDGGRVLFVRQTSTHSLGAVWTIPWGIPEPGEDPSDAALREASEEAGVKAEVTGLLAAQSLPEPWRGTIALVFLCRHVSGTPTPDGVETDAAQYLSATELASINPTEPWSRWLAGKVLSGHTSVLRSLSENPFGPEGFVAWTHNP